MDEVEYFSSKLKAVLSYKNKMPDSTLVEVVEVVNLKIEEGLIVIEGE